MPSTMRPMTPSPSSPLTSRPARYPAIAPTTSHAMMLKFVSSSAPDLWRSAPPLQCPSSDVAATLQTSGGFVSPVDMLGPAAGLPVCRTAEDPERRGRPVAQERATEDRGLLDRPERP